MQFPIFHSLTLGNGMTIALDAILHVILSHGVAIGLVAMIAVSEFIALRRRSEDWEDFARYMIKPAAVIITGIGAVTGVGIWFVTSALAPRGIGSMLRVFFWPWFTEWIVFTTEVVLILIYYFTWPSLSSRWKRTHVYFGLAYPVAGWFSALLITGVLGFMLTSDQWPWQRTLWVAFWNPSFGPQLLLRTSIALLLGSLFATTFLVFMRLPQQVRRTGGRLFGSVILASLGGVILFSWWYLSVVPGAFTSHAVFAVLTSHLSQTPWVFWVWNGVGAAFVALAGLLTLRPYPRAAAVAVIPAIFIAVAFITEFERIREFVRGPYLMPGYLYANQYLIKERPYVAKTSALANAYWYNVSAVKDDALNRGAYLFALNCSMCHTIGGLNAIQDRLRGRPIDAVAVIIKHTERMVPFMTPFSGTDLERHTMAQFLYELTSGEVTVGPTARFIRLSRGGP